jgi:hypothetical protein
MNKEEFLSVAESYYDEYDSLQESPNFYDYEKSFVELWQRFGKECMEKQLNKSSATQDRRKKNSHPLRGHIHIEVSYLPSEAEEWFWDQSLHAGINDLCRSNGLL